MNLEEIARERVKKKKELRKEFEKFLGTFLVFVVLSITMPFIARWLFLSLGIWGVMLVIKKYKLKYGSESKRWEHEVYQKELRKLQGDSEISKKESFDLEEINSQTKVTNTEDTQWDDSELV